MSWVQYIFFSFNYQNFVIDNFRICTSSLFNSYYLWFHNLHNKWQMCFTTTSSLPKFTRCSSKPHSEQCPGCPYLTPVKHWVVSSRTLFVRISRPTDSIISCCNRALLTSRCKGGWREVVFEQYLINVCLWDFWTLICFCFGPYNHCLTLNDVLSNIHRTTSVKRKYLLQILNKLYLV